MTLNELREFVFKNRNRLAIGIAIVTLVAGVVALIERQGQEQNPQEDTTKEMRYPEGSQPLPASVDTSGTKSLTTIIPDEMSIYNVGSSQSSFSESEVVGFAKTLGFGETWQNKYPVDTGYRYIFTKGDKALTVNTSPPSLFFSIGSSLPAGKVPTEEQAIEKGKLLLTKLGLKSLVPLPGSYRLIAADQVHFFATTDSRTANLVSVSFGPEKNGFPIIGDTPADLSATIFLDTTNTVVSLQYYKTDLQVEPTGTVKIKPLDTALTEVESGKGTVVGAEPFEGLDIDAEPNVLSRFSPSSVYLAYYLSGGSDLLPIYVFEGIGAMKSGKGEVIATVYLPAGNP